MEQLADDAHSVEEVKWSTTTTTKTWTSTSSTAETSQTEQELESNIKQLELDKSINSNLSSSLENSQAQDIKISIENKNEGQNISNKSSTTNTSTMQSSTSTTITEVREIAIAEHNKYRRIHGAPDLKPDPRLHDEAQRYADSLAKGNKDNFKTSKTYKYGENIATSTKRDQAEAVKDAVTRMYETVKFYDYQRPGFNVDNKPTGLFTSLIWKSSEKIGVGCAWNQVEENYSIVFYYDPMTNITNEFKENVLPPRA